MLIIYLVFIYFMSQSIASGDLSFSLRKKAYLFYNVITVWLIYSVFSFIFIIQDIALLLTLTIVFLLSLTMYYIHEFRGTNVNFSDILSIGTAKEVANGYTYKIKPIFIVFLILIIAQYIVSIKNIKVLLNAYEFNVSQVLQLNLIRLIIVFAVYYILRIKVSSCDYDYSLNAGENEGYLYNFISSIQIFHKNKIKKNSNKNLDEPSYLINTIYTNSSQNETNMNNKDNPHIIVIMNESFGSVQNFVKTNELITPYYDSLKGLIKGNLYVNTFGGGTANTEFEFLTGMTIGNYEYPVMPYNNFVKRDKYSIARYFKDLNYKTMAMHPYTATNYNRDKVYKRFGFDELVFYNEFKNKKCVRNYVSDESFYKEVIDRFENNKNLNKELFLFGITMQNHSGYKTFDGANVSVDLSTNSSKESIESYLSLMRISDSALKTLFDYFKNENEHVIILFFGDHNASFGNEINKLVFDNNIDYECTRQYMTPFFIYDNKKSNDRFIDGISANFLSLELLKSANLPFDALHKMLNDIYNQYPIYNYHKRKSIADNKLSKIPVDKYFMLERNYLA